MQKPMFKKGDVIVCIDNSSNDQHLTVGKEYTAIKESKYNPSWGLESVEVNSDDGDEVIFFASRFKLKEQPNPKRHKHADLIIAWAEGAEIEFNNSYSMWTPTKYPSWEEDTEYRIKPAVPDDIVVNDYVGFNVDKIVSCNWSKPNIKYTFDGVTAKLKDVQLLASEDC